MLCPGLVRGEEGDDGACRWGAGVGLVFGSGGESRWRPGREGPAATGASARLEAGRGGDQWNCPASVEPASAVVELSGLIAVEMASKYPVPTSRWCLVAV